MFLEKETNTDKRLKNVQCFVLKRFVPRLRETWASFNLHIRNSQNVYFYNLSSLTPKLVILTLQGEYIQLRRTGWVTYLSIFNKSNQGRKARKFKVEGSYKKVIYSFLSYWWIEEPCCVNPYVARRRGGKIGRGRAWGSCGQASRLNCSLSLERSEYRNALGYLWRKGPADVNVDML